MATVKLRNINPLGHVDLPLLRREGYDEKPGVGCLNPGEEFDCPADLAGSAPVGTPSVGEPGTDDYVPASDDYDPGCGLLAQVGNFELAKPASTSTTSTKGK